MLLRAASRASLLNTPRRFLFRPVISLATVCLLGTTSRYSCQGVAAAFSTTSTTSSIMPSPPYQYRTSNNAVPILDLTSLSETCVQQDATTQAAYALSRKAQACLVQARAAVENGNHDDADAVTATLQGYMDQILLVDSNSNSRKPRPANWNNRVEEYLRLRAYQHFLATATLLPPPPLDTTTTNNSSNSGYTDEEYLAGACMGLAQDLARYGLGRATARDVASVQTAATVVGQILEFLLQLDFRNGPLRRKYDGTKYALKSLETLLYELTVTGANDNADGTTTNEPDAKRAKTEQLFPEAELQALQQRMTERDELRESLIKKSRDGQKAAKQSIFALHRGDLKKAKELLQSCHECIVQDLLPIVTQEPPLRGGCFNNVLEEYAEAKLFMTWIYGRELPADDAIATSPSGIVMLPEDFDIALEPEVYLGGLSDLTGEVGRYAVQRGTARDVNGVKLCLQTNGNIYTAMQAMERLPGGMGKKMGAVRNSVEKLERMLYEMSLSEAAGGRSVQTSVETKQEEQE